MSADKIATPVLEVRGLCASVEGAEILCGVDLQIDAGRNACADGPQRGRANLL